MYVEPARNVAANTTAAVQTQTSKQAQNVTQTSQPVEVILQVMADRVHTNTTDGKVVSKGKKDIIGQTGLKGTSLTMEKNSGNETFSVNATLSPKETPSVKELQEAEMEKIHKALEILSEQLPNTEAQFGIHDETNRVTIKLVDKDTKEVIKEIPPEKTLDTIAKCMKMAGILVDEKL